MALIVIQRGHYPRKTGATGTSGVDADPTEQEFAVAAANACSARLKAAGHTVSIINADVADWLYRGDAFVAIHCDGSTSSSARGASVGYRNADGQRLAAAWKRHYAAAGWSGFRPDNYTAALAGYYGVRRAVDEGNRRAFIAEAGFLTSPQDEAALWPAGPDRFARALTAAVVEIFGGQQPQEDDMTPAECKKAVQEVLDANAKRVQGITSFVGLVTHIRNDAKAARLNTTDLDQVDVAELAALVVSELSPEAIAAAIPVDIADRVVDEIHRRTAPES